MKEDFFSFIIYLTHRSEILVETDGGGGFGSSCTKAVDARDFS